MVFMRLLSVKTGRGQAVPPTNLPARPTDRRRTPANGNTAVEVCLRAATFTTNPSINNQGDEFRPSPETIMSASAKTKWNIEADFLQACNCDYGCPCEFSAPPTRGFCEGMGAWKITRGNYGDVKLDGLGVAFAARWPKAIHEGGGTACLFFDERATPPQRDALLKARFRGVRTVEYDGKRVTYASDAELAAAITDVERRIASADEGGRRRRILTSASKGL